MYRIGEFSKLGRCTVKTLRFYDETGLLAPAYVDRFTGYRYYSTEQLFVLQKILALREAGFAIEEIVRILSGEDADELIRKKEDELCGEIDSLIRRRKRLAAINNFYREERTMDYQAIIKQLPSYIVYTKRFRVKDFSDYGTVIPQIGAEIAEANPGLECSEPDYCYVEYVEGEYKEHDFEVEYAEAVKRAGKDTETIRFKTLPPTQVVAIMHRGGYGGLSKAYAYAMQWIETNGYRVVGNAREQYIHGCWDKTSEDEYLTEVQIPIEKV